MLRAPPRWRACAVAADCVVIPTYCGGADAVSVRGRELAAAFYARLSMTKDCVVKPPRDAATLKANPLGIYVNAINWSRELDPSNLPPNPPPKILKPSGVAP